MKRAGTFAWGALIGILGGLIGLGGAEFRLPVLVSFYKFRTLQAVVINLVVSLVTVTFSLIFRVGLADLGALTGHSAIILDLLCGSLIGSYLGVRFATRIDEGKLTRVVALLLVALSFVLVGHDYIFHARDLPLTPLLRFALGAGMGVMIGVVSSMLGVAGGELIIPTIIILFGVGIKLAGSLSLAVSIPTIIMGLVKYRRRGKLGEAWGQLSLIVWMSLGSILGAFVGSYLLTYVRVSLLQVLLGLILLVSAVKLWRTHHKTALTS
jgi:uncharacterized membrane protein YfcA